MNSYENRNSSIELLRILSVMMIISLHVLGYYFNDTRVIIKEYILFINAVFNTGVTLFILISGYFGINRKRKKLIGMFNIIWFYSIVSAIAVYLSGSELSLKYIVSSLFPVLTNKYWFLTSYVLLFILSPYLNMAIERLSQKDVLILLSCLLFFFYLAPTILRLQIIKDSGKGPVNMILIYLAGRYLRIYGFPNLVKKHSLLICLLSISIIFLGNSGATLLSGHIDNSLARDNSIFILSASICIFHWFVKRHFHSSIINTLASCTMEVYMFHSVLLMFVPHYDSVPIILSSSIMFPIIIWFCSVLFELARRKAFGKLFERLATAEMNATAFLT